jgi:hypothetical protein
MNKSKSTIAQQIAQAAIAFEPFSLCGKAFNQAAPAERRVGQFTHAGGHRP